MKNKKINKKKILLIIFVLVILTVALVFLIKHLYSTDELYISQNKLVYINSAEWNNETYPKGMPVFVRAYSGKQTAQNIGKSIYYVSTELIPKYNEKLKDASKDEKIEFFEKNKELVTINFGIKNQRDFMNLMDEILKLNSDELKLESFYIDEKSIQVTDTSTKAVLNIKYENCEEISINIKALNNIQENASSVLYY